MSTIFIIILLISIPLFLLLCVLGFRCRLRQDDVPEEETRFLPRDDRFDEQLRGKMLNHLMNQSREEEGEIRIQIDQDEIRPFDYDSSNEVDSLNFADGTKFQVYDPVCFQKICSHFNYKTADFLDAFSQPLQLGPSNGKSSSIFLYTACNRFLFKTTRGDEGQNLLNLLEEYLAHLEENHESILPRYLALVSMDQNQVEDEVFAPGKYTFVLIANWFYTDFFPVLKFDFKVSFFNLIIHRVVGWVARVSPF